MKIFDKETIKEWYDKEIISKKMVPLKRLERILTEIGNDSFEVWSEEDFNPENKPPVNSGITICYECGKMYWSTPFEDAYVRSSSDESEGRICGRCLRTI